MCDVVKRVMEGFFMNSTMSDKVKEGSWIERESQPYKTN